MRPKGFRLFGKAWTVKYVERVDDQDNWGECKEENAAIRIKEGMDPQQERCTLLHECIHAIEESLGLDLTEKTVLALEAGLYDLLISNPQLFSYLKQRRDA